MARQVIAAQGSTQPNRKIVLIRHGPAAIDRGGSLTCREFGDWITAYEAASIRSEEKPAAALVAEAALANFIVASPAPRCLASAHALGLKTPDLIDSAYRECEMPFSNRGGLKLSTASWSVVFRLLQLLGYSNNAESRGEIIERSKSCAARLADLVDRYGTVLLVGHGALNWLIHRRLTRLGWQGPSFPASKPWQYTVLHPPISTGAKSQSS